MKILEGTEAKADATPKEIAEALEALQKRGEREALRARIGCALTVIGVLVSGVLLYLGFYYVLGIEGLIVLLVYHYATSLDPELADDPRLQFAVALMKAFDDEPKVGDELNFWMELNAYDMELPDERKAIEAGCVRSMWKQDWFRCTFDWGEQERTLEIRLEAVQEQDGIHVAESSVTHFLTLRPGKGGYQSDETPDAAATMTWLRDHLSPRAEAS
ncbi:MAG: hypothetical protein ACI9KE_000492 [Polyangiales bacterium]|jgi:hypothetical protein